MSEPRATAEDRPTRGGRTEDRAKQRWSWRKDKNGRTKKEENPLRQGEAEVPEPPRKDEEEVSDGNKLNRD